MASKLTGNGPGSQEKVTAVRTTTRIARTRRTQRYDRAANLKGLAAR
jgi:hypothetical protein